MEFHGFRNRDWRALRLPGALLLGLLQRWPLTPPAALRQVVSSGAALTAVARVLGLAGAHYGSIHAQTGATQFVVSGTEPIQGVVGEELTVAFSITATPTAPNRFFIDTPLPPGLVTIPALNGNRVSSGTPVITGASTEAGVFAVSVTGSDGFHSLTHTLIFEIAAKRTSTVTAEPAGAIPGHVVEFSLLTELSSAAPALDLRVTARSGAGASMLVRALGPSLVPFGTSDVLPDPRLSLLDDSGVVSMNDDWNGDSALAAAVTAAGAFPFSDPRSADAALLTPTSPGSQVWRADSATPAAGTLLLQVLPLTSDVEGGGSLLGASFRHRVDPHRAIVLGFVVRGGTPTRIVLRARTSSPLDAASARLAALTLFDVAGNAIATEGDVTETGTTTFTLAPGAYTAVIQGEDSPAEVQVDWSTG